MRILSFPIRIGLMVLMASCVITQTKAQNTKASSTMECVVDAETGAETCSVVKEKPEPDIIIDGKGKVQTPKAKTVTAETYKSVEADDITVNAPKPAPPQKKSLTPEEITLECGGIMVLPAGKEGEECLDYANDCQSRVADDPEGCDDEDDQLHKCCKVSCSICEETKPAEKRGTIGVPQRNDGIVSEREGVDKVLTEMTRYLSEEVLTGHPYRLMYHECVNQNDLCAFWASIGECDNNFDYMKGSCMLACKLCNQHNRFLRTMKVGY